MPVIEELQRRLPPVNAICEARRNGREYAGGNNDVDAGEEDGMPC